jgi:hypothetical protein
MQRGCESGSFELVHVVRLEVGRNGPNPPSDVTVIDFAVSVAGRPKEGQMKAVCASLVIIFLGTQPVLSDDVVFPPMPPAEEEVLMSLPINIEAALDSRLTEIVLEDGEVIVSLAAHAVESSGSIPEPPGTDPKSVTLFGDLGMENEIGTYVTRGGDTRPMVPTYVTIRDERVTLPLESYKWTIDNDFRVRIGKFDFEDLGYRLDLQMRKSLERKEVHGRIRILSVVYYNRKTAEWDDYYNNQLNATHRRRYDLESIAETYEEARAPHLHVAEDGKEIMLHLYKGRQMKDVYEDLRVRFRYSDGDGVTRVIEGLEDLIARDSLGVWVDVGFKYDVKVDQLEKGEHLAPSAKELVPPANMIWKIAPFGPSGLRVWNYRPGEVLFSIDILYEIYRVIEE